MTHVPGSTGLPEPIEATSADLPDPVAAVLDAPAERVDPGRRTTTVAAGIPFSSIAWGDPSDRPLVLLHGVTASARIWWRIGPALARTGRHVVAPDLPGHGLTGHWQGHHAFRDNASDIAAWIRASSLNEPRLQIVGHSWGAVTAAALPRAGVRPATLVLVDPPAIPLAVIARIAGDAAEQPPSDLAGVVAAVAAENPSWSRADVGAKAEALSQLDVAAARSIVLDNGDWDGGLADLLDPAADGVPTWIVRGDPAIGGFLADARLPGFAARIGADHILSLRGAPHAPQRTHAPALTLALLRSLA